MPQALPDDVLSAAQSGDAEAFSQIYYTLAPGVSGYLKARGMEDAEGSAQEVFLTVFSRIGTVRGGYQGLRTFAFSVAHARYVDEVRKRARQPYVSEYDPETDARTSDSAETVALEALGGSTVEEKLRELPPDQREVLLLRIVADLSLEETARVMGKRANAIKALQHRALANLRALLAQDVTP